MTISIKRIRKLNPWIKSDEQARKIIKTYHTEPKAMLSIRVETEQEVVKKQGRY